MKEMMSLSSPDSTHDIATHVQLPTQNSSMQLMEKQNQLSNEKKIVTSLIAGAMAGALAKTVIAPFDRTKIYFQVHSQRFNFSAAIQFVINSLKTEGITSLWRGNSATMARVVPFAAIQFSAHEQWKRVLSSDADGKHLSAVSRYMAGSLAGVSATSLTYPLDLVRARMAVTERHVYRHIGDVFTKIVSTEGWLALYRGFTPTLMGVVPYAGTSFFTYETLKKYAQDVSGTDSPSPLQRLLCGAVAGLLGQTTSYPLDVVRRRMQTSATVTKGVRHTLLHVIRTEGVGRGLFKGVTMNWVKGPIAVSTSFATFDFMLYNLRRLPFLRPEESGSST